MKKLATACLLLAQGCLAASVWAQTAAPASLSVVVAGIDNNQPIAEKFAYCAPADNASKDGGNVNPAISWAGAPAGTQSYALLVTDPDVPSNFDSANQAGKTIPADLPRRNFYHWVLVDIPASSVGISEGADSKGITPGGKAPGKTAYGINGQNDYASFGKGQGGGYDGPCPPWNDERVHHYHFTVYALDVPSLKLGGNFTGKQAETAMAGHILARGEVVGIYTDNAKLAAH